MGILDNITQGLSDAYAKAKEAVQGPAQQAADTTGLSNVNVQGVTPEAPGTTTTGAVMGGRRRRTRRSKKSKKTHRRRKY